jgi:hypothetical protein
MPRDEEKLPKIAWRNEARQDDGLLRFFKAGEKMRFEVEVSPSKVTKEAISAVYLFDAGYLIGCKTEPPYVFDVEMTEQWYSRTRYMNTGRQKVVPDLAKAPHSFVAFVQDKKGEVAFTQPVIRRHPAFFNPATRPFEAVAAKIPGRIWPWRYDEGGAGVAYHDTSKGNGYSKSKQEKSIEGNVDCTASELASVMPGEWINYTVDVAKSGAYRLKMRYGTAHQGNHSIYVVLDGETIGVLNFSYTDDADSWKINREAFVEKLKLPAGRHVISFYFHSQLNIGSFDFSEVQGENN